MQITVRELWTMVHGMGFGVLYLMACSGALVELWRMTVGRGERTDAEERFLKVYLLAMVVLAWGAVLTGAYVVYPWYRAVPQVPLAGAERGRGEGLLGGDGVAGGGSVADVSAGGGFVLRASVVSSVEVNRRKILGQID